MALRARKHTVSAATDRIIDVAIVSETKRLTATELTRVRAALHKQLTRDLQPV